MAKSTYPDLSLILCKNAKKAIRSAVKEHRQAGRKIPILVNGKVVYQFYLEEKSKDQWFSFSEKLISKVFQP